MKSLGFEPGSAPKATSKKREYVKKGQLRVAQDSTVKHKRDKR